MTVCFHKDNIEYEVSNRKVKKLIRKHNIERHFCNGNGNKNIFLCEKNSWYSNEIFNFGNRAYRNTKIYYYINHRKYMLVHNIHKSL